MTKTKLKGIPFKFADEIISENSELKFKAVNTDGSIYDISKERGRIVISIFPDINTKVCDAQTMKISQLASKYKNITFLSISMDTPKEQAEWCAAKGIDNIKIVSDKERREFGKATNLYIPKLKKLGRGLIVLDGKKNIIKLAINKELTVEPSWDKIEEYLSN